MPRVFARQPRSLIELERWKATEFRQFLLYTGPIVLRNVVADKTYTHFLALSIAMSIMLDVNTAGRNAYLAYAQQLLQYFVNNCKHVYGETFAVYNVHSLLHLHEDVSFYGCSLNEISCFPFENFMQHLKKLVRNGNNPVAQVGKVLHQTSIYACFKQLERWVLFTGQQQICVCKGDQKQWATCLRCSPWAAHWTFHYYASRLKVSQHCAC